MLKNQKGFTLVEMLIVLLVISVLIVLAIPNIGKHFETVDSKGCEAYVSMVQGQVEAYRLEKNEYPTTLDDLKNAEYLKADNMTCPNGEEIEIVDGEVRLKTEVDGTGGDGSTSA